MQTSLPEWDARDFLGHLKGREMKVLKLLHVGLHQADIARKLKMSASTVSLLVQSCQEHGFIRERTVREIENMKYLAPMLPPDQRVRRYILVEPLRALVEQVPESQDDLTFCEPHNIRLRYRIRELRGILSRDRRTGYLRTWRPKGPERHLFWVAGREGNGSTTIEIHPHSLVAYWSAEVGPVVSRDPAEAETQIRLAVHECVLRWQSVQASFGCVVDLAMPKDLDGIQVSHTHYAFPVPKQAVEGAEGSHLSSGFWIDASPVEQGQPGIRHVETAELSKAEQVDRGLHTAMSLDGSLREISSKIDTVAAHVQSGTTVQQQYQQLMGLLANTLLRVGDLENKERKDERKRS